MNVLRKLRNRPVVRKIVNRLRPEVSESAFLSPLGEPFASVLCSMYAREPQLGSDGKLHPIDTTARISSSQGMWIYQLIRDMKPERTLEIGLALGFSTVYFLAALQKNGKGNHIAIDPFEYLWHDVGLTRAKVTNVAPGTFTHINEHCVKVLTKMWDEERRFDVILIDGDHKFDGVMIDFYLTSLVCGTGGFIIFDDLMMLPVRRCIDFVRKNRADFIEVDTGLPNMTAFRKVGDDKRNLTDPNFFVPF